jgi:hypothetical protein
MSESHLVARTADGLNHINTLTHRKLWTVLIYIDAPDEQAEKLDCGDSYQLSSDEGLYDETLQRSDAVRLDEKRMALRFTEVIPEGTYSLYHLLACGVEFPVFMSVPFEDLEDSGKDAQEPDGQTWEPPKFQPEPKLVSGDPLLLHHEDDHAVPKSVDDWAPLDGEPSDPLQSDEADA